MGYRNYLQYDQEDYDPSSANSNNVDLPMIKSAHTRVFNRNSNQLPQQDHLSNYYYSDDWNYAQQAQSYQATQPQQYFDAIDLEKYEVSNITNQISEKFSKLYPQNTIELNQVFWKIFLYIALIPLVNSAIFNVVSLSKNVFQLIELKSEYRKLSAEKEEVLTKMKAYHSPSGMKRTIKEELKAIEQNEILVKIL